MLSSPKWQNKSGVWHYHVQEALVFCLTNVIDLFVQLHVILRVDIYAFDYVLLVNDASVVPENGEHNILAEG